MSTFHNILFPESIAINLERGVIFKSDVVETYDNQEIRTQNKHMRYIYKLPEVRLSKIELCVLEDFFVARSGKVYSFRLRDPNDYMVEKQIIGVVGKNKLQLMKTYQNGPYYYARFITKPQKDTLNVMVNGVQVPSFAVNYNTGQVLINEDLQGNVVVDFEFDIHVRFDMDQFIHEKTEDGCYIVKDFRLIEVSI